MTSKLYNMEQGAKLCVVQWNPSKPDLKTRQNFRFRWGSSIKGAFDIGIRRIDIFLVWNKGLGSLDNRKFFLDLPFVMFGIFERILGNQSSLYPAVISATVTIATTNKGLDEY